MEEKKALIVAVAAIQLIYAGSFLLTKIAFDVGINTFVIVFYRQAVASFFLLPVSIIFERKSAPPLTISIFIEIFVLSFIGITVSVNLFSVGLKYTSASLGAAADNALPVITFFLALLFRMEKMDLRTWRGIMKVGGVFLSAGGIATIAFYRGPLLKIKLWNPLITIQHNHHQVIEELSATTIWIKGVLLVLLANITWALWLILQARFLKSYPSYPSKLWYTTLQSLFSTIQCGIVALAFARDYTQWKIGWNIELLSVLYSAIGVTCIIFYLQAWVIEKKGPVFYSMATPLTFAFTIVISLFVLGQTSSLGSIFGTILLVGGLYLVLSGKSKEEEIGVKDGREAMGDTGKAKGRALSQDMV